MHLRERSRQRPALVTDGRKGGVITEQALDPAICTTDREVEGLRICGYLLMGSERVFSTPSRMILMLLPTTWTSVTPVVPAGMGATNAP